MKVIVFLFGLLFSCICNAQFSILLPDYVSGDGIVGWYKLNGDAMNNWPVFPNGVNNGAVATTDRFNDTNRAMHFNGAEWIDLISNFDEDERTVSMWLFVDQNSPTGQTILDNDYPSLAFGNTLLEISSNNQINAGMGLSTCVLDSAILNTWYHAAITRDSVNTTFYLNGIQICQLSNDNTTSASALDTNMKLGASRNLDNFFYGKIDDVGIWNRALSDCEIQKLFSAQIINDVSVNQNGGVLEANQSGAQYQWYACGEQIGYTLLQGETSQQFSPSFSGDYAVLLDYNGCSDLSDCYAVNFSGIGELNPLGKQRVKIIDGMGRVIEEQPNTLLIYVYSDGTTDKVFIVE